MRVRALGTFLALLFTSTLVGATSCNSAQPGSCGDRETVRVCPAALSELIETGQTDKDAVCGGGGDPPMIAEESVERDSCPAVCNIDPENPTTNLVICRYLGRDDVGIYEFDCQWDIGCDTGSSGRPRGAGAPVRADRQVEPRYSGMMSRSRPPGYQ